MTQHVPDKIIERIQKLMALSQSSNVHEASNAAARAAELLADYNLSMGDVGEVSEDADAVESEVSYEYKTRSTPRWIGILFNGVVKGFGCQGWLTRNRARTSRPYLTVVGRRSALDTVKYMFPYLMNEINRLCEVEFTKLVGSTGKGHGKTWRNNFRVAAAGVISERLREVRENKIDEVRYCAAPSDAQKQALIRLDETSAAIEKLMPGRLGKQARSRSAFNAQAHSAGLRAGASIGLGGSAGSLGTGNRQLRG